MKRKQSLLQNRHTHDRFDFFIGITRLVHEHVQVWCLNKVVTRVSTIYFRPLEKYTITKLPILLTVLAESWFVFAWFSIYSADFVGP